MSQDSPTPVTGSLVDVRGDRWRVVETVEHGGCWSCRLSGASASNLGADRTLLLPFDRPRAVVRRTRPRRVGRRRFVAGLRALLAADCAGSGLRGISSAGIDLLEYQLEPAMACARGATRVLLADEVGLGKTIQAGVILADLRARDPSARALVLCPAGLLEQWIQELRTRLGLAPDLADRGALQRRFRLSATGAAAWEQMSIAVASIDFVKQPEVLQGMEDVTWDVLVVDEAHLCAVARERAAAIGRLAERARRVVLLTATPHPGEPDAFRALCGVGRLPGEGPILMFRRTRAGLGMHRERRSHLLEVALSPVERRLHALLDRYTSRVWAAVGEGCSREGARLAMIVLRKRAASGVAPLLASLERRLRLLDDSGVDAESQLPLPFEDEDGRESSDDEPDDVLGAPGLADVDAERAMVGRLVELARAAGGFDSKLRVLFRLLLRAREPAVVFTEYRDTLAHLVGRAGAGGAGGIVAIHGGMDHSARADAVSAFTSGDANWLFATDAAAHGLNLQARCRLVINLELPWNPLRLEQRAGRVDRIGQRRRVHVVHLVARRTSEEEILARLAARIERARLALDPAPGAHLPASEADVAAAIFRGSRHLWRGSSDPRPPADPCPGSSDLLFLPASLSPQAHAEAARLRRIRALTAGHRTAIDAVSVALARTRPWWTTIRLRASRLPTADARGFASADAVAVFEAGIVDGRGLLVETVLVPIAIASPARSSISGAGRRAPFAPGDQLLSAMEAAAAHQASRRLAEVREALLPALRMLTDRDDCLARAGDLGAVEACQPGLFDLRAARRAEEGRRARLVRQEERRNQSSDVRRAAELSLAGPPDLVLLARLRILP